MFWGLLFGLLFFIPVFGMAVGAGFGALFRAYGKEGIDKQFQEQVRDMLKPGTSLPIHDRRADHARQGSGRTEQIRRHRAPESASFLAVHKCVQERARRIELPS